MDARKLNVVSHISLTSKQLRDLAWEYKVSFAQVMLLGMVALESGKGIAGRQSLVMGSYGCGVVADLARN